MTGGVFAVSRGIFDHGFFAKEALTEREAWIWLIGEAAWKSRRVRVGDHMISLSRGQCAFSVRFLADKWGWSKSKVTRFLDRLKTETMIGTDAGQGVSVITICNYNDYQKVSLPSETETGTHTGTDAGQMRDKEEDREKHSIQETNTPSGPSALPAKNIEAEVFRLGKRVLGKSAGGVIVNLRKACDYDDEQALDLLRQAGEKHEPMAWVQAAIRSVADRPYRGVSNVPSEAQVIESREDREWKRIEAEIYRNVL